MQIQHQAALQRENIPLLCFWQSKAQRHLLMMFYDAIRGLDNISDDPTRSPQERLAMLRAIYDQPPVWLQPYVAACKSGALNPAYGEQLMQAFMQDQTQTRLANWDALIAYSNLSAVPFGQGVLAIAGVLEVADKAAFAAVCQALQILNHLQDMKADYVQLDRIYVPADMLQAAGVTEQDLAADACSFALREVCDAVLEQCRSLLRTAQALPTSLPRLGIRLQARMVLLLAQALLQQLQRHDPLAQRVTLSRGAFTKALMQACWQEMLRRG
jgi:hydroxysqualene synthase